VNACTPQVAFATNGPRTITLTGKDAQGATAQATVTITVADPPAAPAPIVTIDNLKDGDHRLSTQPMTLKATATDPEGKSPMSYRWTVKYGKTEKTIATGNSRNGRQFRVSWKPYDDVPHTCGSQPVTLSLYVVDPDGDKAGPGMVSLLIDLVC